MWTRVYFKEVRGIALLAFPIVIGQLSQMLMGVLDSLMIGRVGTVPLAASGLSVNVFSFFYIFAIGLLQPISVLVARARGRGQEVEALAHFHHGLAAALLLGVLECAAMLALGTQLHRFGQPPEVIAEARPFFNIMAVSIIPTLVFQACRQFCEAQGRPWEPMMILLGSVGLNVILNFLWIYGSWGTTAHGLVGAGWATFTARCVATLGVAWLLFNRGNGLARDFSSPKFEYEKAKFAELLRLGIPAGSQLLFEGGAFTAAAVMMGWLGTEALAAHQIALSCIATTFMFVLGISIAVSIRISEASGAGQFERLRPIGWSGLSIGAGIMTFFAVVLFFFGGQIAGWFVKDAAVVTLATRLLVVAALFQIFDGGQVVGSAMLRGLSDVKVPTAITLVAYWGLAIPAGYGLGLHTSLGALGLWWGLAGGLCVAAFLFAVRFHALTRNHGPV